jgi:hypothetical protein
MSMRRADSWVRFAASVVVAGCASTDSDTRAPAGPRFVVDLPESEVHEPLPEDPVDPAVQAVSCGLCGLRCGPGLRCAGEVCTPGSDNVARLIAPESFGRVTSQRPTFRWVLPANVQGARWHLCRDRACAEVLREVDLVGQSMRPEAPLAPGVYFWRVRARRGNFVSNKPTPVWEFVVGARESGVDTVQGRIPDLNGDGHADVLLRLGPDRPAGLYLGSPTGLVLAPAVRIGAPEGDGVEGHLSVVGDLDGDGFLDGITVATRDGDPAQRAVYLYRGGPSGLPTMPVQLARPAGVERWPDSFRDAGDLNADGYADLAGVDRERDGVAGRVRVFFGSPQGIQAAPGVLLQGELGDGLGAAFSGGGDVNGDGRPDLLVGSPSVTAPGRALVWTNRVGVCLHSEVTPLHGDASAVSLFGQDLSVVADLNGDGHADPLVAEPYGPAVDGRSHVVLFQGAAPGVETAPARTVSFTGAQTEGIGVRAGGDFNGDGYGDVVVRMHNEGRGPSMYLFYGSPAGMPVEPSRVIYPSDVGSPHTALSFAWTGDADRDGYDDLMMSLLPTEWFLLRGSAEGLRVVDGPRIELP